MNRFLALLALVLLVLAAPGRGAWQDELTKDPGKFPPLRPFHATYKFGWALVSAADATIDLIDAKGGQRRLEVTAHTKGPVRVSWRMDTTHSARMLAATLRPVSLLQKEVYSREKLTTQVNFTAEGVSRLRQAEPPDANPPKTKTFDFPGVFDLHSALHFIRSQPLKDGDVYKIVVYPSAAPYLAEIRVAGRTRLKAAGKTWPAIKMDLGLTKITSELKLVPHEKFKRASAWLSDDADRLFLRVESEVFVGAVWGELDTIQFTPAAGTKVAAP